MEVHRAQATPAPSEHSLTYPFIGDFLSSVSLSSSDYGSDCSTLPSDGSINGNREYSPSEDSSGYIVHSVRLTNDDQSDFSYAPSENIHIKTEPALQICSQCQQQIHDKCFISADGRTYHENCLQCSICDIALHDAPKCFFKNQKFYCKGCYFREFSPKCASCDRSIQKADWVRRARTFVYHLACFACNQCKRQLSTGEEYALQEGKLLCKQHFLELVEGDSGVSSQKAKTKRVRTTFADDQLSVLQTYFNRDSNPDGADLEKIATMTGLSKRVTQVWFQNSRARQKKWHQKSDGDNEGSQRSSVGPLSPGQKSDSSGDMMYPTSVTTSVEDTIPDSIINIHGIQYD